MVNSLGKSYIHTLYHTNNWAISQCYSVNQSIHHKYEKLCHMPLDPLNILPLPFPT